MSKKMQIIEPFQPLEPEDKRPAHKRVAITEGMELEAVAQYRSFGEQIKLLQRRRSELAPIIVNAARAKAIRNEKGDLVCIINGSEVKIQDRIRYEFIDDMAVRLFEEKGILDKVATRVLSYEMKPRFARKVASRIYALLEKLGIVERVAITTAWVFNEDAIEDMYNAGEITVEELQQVTEPIPIGKGYALIVGGEEAQDE